MLQEKMFSTCIVQIKGVGSGGLGRHGPQIFRIRQVLDILIFRRNIFGLLLLEKVDVSSFIGKSLNSPLPTIQVPRHLWCRFLFSFHNPKHLSCYLTMSLTYLTYRYCTFKCLTAGGSESLEGVNKGVHNALNLR